MAAENESGRQDGDILQSSPRRTSRRASTRQSHRLSHSASAKSEKGNATVTGPKTQEQRQDAMARGCNHFAAVLMPLVEAGAVAYATYVLVYTICIRYLLNPPSQLQAVGVVPRKGTGIALLVLYFFFLLAMSLAYLRLIQVIWTNPGFIPRHATPEQGAASTKQFDRLDAFVCDYNGNPIWCYDCNCWKPDRTHHCSAIGRCVQRMDHHCPWAGGIISETSHKFFIQFLWYGSLYTLYTLIVTAIFSAEHHRKFHRIDGKWIGAVAALAFFFLFAISMFATHVWYALNNLTSVEANFHKGSVTHLALLKNQLGATTHHSKVLCEVQRSPSRSYVVVATEPGTNPWDLGYHANWKSIMGNSLLDWFLPLRMSPHCDHSGDVGRYEWSKAVEKLMDEVDAGRPLQTSRGSRRSRPRT